MPVEEITGIRQKSTIFHKNDGYFYLKSTGDSSRLYLRCFKNKCNARASVPVLKEDRTLESFRTTRDHNHPPDNHFLAVVDLKKAIIDRCLNDSVTSLREIFYEECDKVPIEVSRELTYEQLKSSMYRARRASTPLIPQTLQQVSKILKHPAYARFSKSVSNDEFFKGRIGGKSIVFASHHLFQQLLPQCKELHIDGSFKAIPKLPRCKQMVMIMATHYNHLFPVMFVFMENNSLEAYENIFNFLRNKVPELNPPIIVTDFESTLLQAATNIFPDSSVVGCWFHSSNAMKRKARSLGLIKYISGNSCAKRVLKMTMALALLPQNLVKDTFSELLDYAQRNKVAKKLDTYLKYVQCTWVEGEEATYLSVVGQQWWTVTDKENIHQRLFRRLRLSQPNFWTFIDSLKAIEGSYRKKYIGLDNGQEEEKKHLRGGHRRIEVAMCKLMSGQYTGWEYLSTVSHAVTDIEINDEEEDLKEGNGHQPDSPINSANLEEPHTLSKNDLQEEDDEEIDYYSDMDIDEDDKSQLMDTLIKMEALEETHTQSKRSPGHNSPQQPEEIDSYNQKDPPYYYRYRTLPTTYRRDTFLPERVIEIQHSELADAMKIGPAEEPSFEADEHQLVCTVCKINAATRMAIPCAHYVVCRKCLPTFVGQIIYHEVTGPDGEQLTTPLRHPITCPECEAIVGQLIPTN